MEDLPITQPPAPVSPTFTATTTTATPAKPASNNSLMMLVIGFLLGAVIAGAATAAFMSNQARNTNNAATSSSSSKTSTQTATTSADSSSTASSMTSTSATTQSATSASSQAAVTMKTCTNTDLKISIQVPQSWKCTNSSVQQQYYLAVDGDFIEFSIGTDAIGYLPNSAPLRMIKLNDATKLAVAIYYDAETTRYEVIGGALAKGKVSNVQIFASNVTKPFGETQMDQLEMVLKSYKQI
jgi:gas vesicle protein